VADPTYTFLLTGAPDASVHVWSVPSLLTFTTNTDTSAPLHTLAQHRGPITAIAMGHSHGSTGVAITASEDKSCLVWGYRTGTLLHTFLLTSTPLCLAVDPADRGFVVGQADGAVQLVDFYSKGTVEHPVHSYDSPMTAVSEPERTDRWIPEASEKTAIHSIAITYDGTKVLTGHESGRLHAWDLGTGKMVHEKIATMIGSVTNLCMLPITGLARPERELTTLTTVVKPKHAGLLNVPEGQLGSLPEKYVLQARFQRPITAYPARDVWNGGPRANPLMADFAACAFEAGWTATSLEEDIAALQEPELTGRRSVLSVLSSQGETEVEELHGLLARKTEESLELRARVEQLGTELVRLRQANRDRKRLHRIKRVRRSEAEEQRRKSATHTAPAETNEAPPGQVGSSSESDDLSVGD
jgi:hypothetical protein